MPQVYKIILSAEAQRNIEEAFLWIAESDETAALRWYDGIIAVIGELARFPLRCPIAPESRLGLVDQEVRQLLYGKSYWKYRILFAVERDRVLVAHVRHGARLYLGEPMPEDESS